MDPYEELGLPRDATDEQIKAAHRAGVRKNHPDAGGDPERFALVQRSYEILSKPERRARFDETGDTEDDQFGRQQAEIREAIQAFLSMILATDIDLEKNDMLEFARQQLRAIRARLAEQLRNARNQQRRTGQLAKRMKKRAGAKAPAELVLTALERLQLEANKTVLKAQGELDKHTQIAAVFMAMQYDWDRPPEVDPRAYFNSPGLLPPTFLRF
jgi:curved DNA-binding protein CbpA